MHNMNQLITCLEEIRDGTRRLSPMVKVEAYRLLSPNDPACDGYLRVRSAKLVQADPWRYVVESYWKQSESERFDLPYAHAVVVAGLLNDKLIGPAIDYLNDVLNGVPV